jgi:hypothetical protein
MPRKSKAKLDMYVEIPLQIEAKTSIEEHVVTVTGSGNSDVLLEKRKEDADKPLYLKRL